MLFTGFGGWCNASDFNIANDAILEPGISYVIRNNSSSPFDIRQMGTVQTTEMWTQFSKPQANTQQDVRFSVNSAAPVTLGNFGLADDGDQIFAFDETSSGQNKSASTILQYYSGTGWLNNLDFTDASNFQLKPGVGYVLRAAAPGPAEDRVVVTPWPYTP